jgi:hypothetical protein
MAFLLDSKHLVEQRELKKILDLEFLNPQKVGPWRNSDPHIIYKIPSNRLAPDFIQEFRPIRRNWLLDQQSC